MMMMIQFKVTMQYSQQCRQQIGWLVSWFIIFVLLYQIHRTLKEQFSRQQKIKRLANVLSQLVNLLIIRVKSDQNKYIIRVQTQQIKNKTDQPHHQYYTMIKIYYLKNDILTNNLQSKPVQQKKPKLNILINNQNNQNKNKPSLSCLSSLIQCDKNACLIDDQVYMQSMQRGYSLNHVQAHKDDVTKRIIKKHNNSHQKTIQIQQLLPFQQQQQASKKFLPRKAITEEINNNNNNRNPLIQSIQQRAVVLPTKHRRLTQASQEQIFSLHKKSNNQAFSKDFLCNIVKEWSNFTQVQELVSKRAKLKKWRTPQAEQHYKVSSHRVEEKDELRKNKSLMQQHFNMFIQSQKNKKSILNQKKSSSIMNAVFNSNNNKRDNSSSYHSISKIQSSNNNPSHNNTNISNKQISLMMTMDNNNNSISHRSRLKEYKRSYCLNMENEQRVVVNRRRVSMQQKSDKKQEYLRLMYGPQVKLLPKLFEESGKGRNFNWTKLDKDVFDSSKKVRCSA